MVLSLGQSEFNLCMNYGFEYKYEISLSMSFSLNLV